MTTLVLDIETLPLASSLAEPYPDADRLPPGNYKNPEAIAGWREKDKAAWQEQRVKECSLTPRLGRIASLGWTVDDGSVAALIGTTEAEEVGILNTAWALIGNASRIVTFNGAFDLRFIAVRSAVLGIAVPPFNGVHEWFRRYTTSPHFDCRAVLTGWDDRQSGKLGEWCASFGIPSRNATTGADIFQHALLGEWDAIAAHCRHDVEQTRELYKRIAPLFL